MSLGPNLVVDYDFEADDPAWLFVGSGVRTNTPWGSLNSYYAKAEGPNGPPVTFLQQDMSGVVSYGVVYQIDFIFEEDANVELITRLGQTQMTSLGIPPPQQAVFSISKFLTIEIAGLAGKFVGIDEIQIREVISDELKAAVISTPLVTAKIGGNAMIDATVSPSPLVTAIINKASS